MLLTLYNYYMQQGNPSYLVSIAPGGTGTTQTAITVPSQYYPYVGLPTIEPVEREWQDTPANGIYNVTTATPQGTVMSPIYTSGNTTGYQWSIPQLYAQPLPKLQFGVVNKRSDVTADPGGFTLGYSNGVCQAFCTTGANAIAPGTLLTTDGNGNLTSYNNPSAAPTPSLSTNGSAGSTTYTYGLIAVSANGTYSALGTTASIATGNATLTFANSINITWTPVADAVSYIIVRTSAAGTPSSLGVIGTVPATQAYFVDTGIVAAPNTSATQFFARLAAPSAPTVVSGGTSGATTYQYKVTAILPNGVWSAESTTGSVTNAAATLTSTAYTTITWTNVTGAVSYAIDRTSAAGTPSTTGFIGFANNGTVGFRDIGYAATTFTAQTTPNPTPAPGTCLAISLGTLASSTSTAALVPVLLGGF